MSLLDSDSEIIKKSQDKKGSGRKSGSSGLSRFKNLNKFSGLTEKYREKKQDEPLKDASSETKNNRNVETSNAKKETLVSKDIKQVAGAQNTNAIQEKQTNNKVSAKSIKPESPKNIIKHDSISKIIANEENINETANSKQITNGLQTGSDQDTKQIQNRVQSDYKIDSEQITNGLQTGSDQDTKQTTISKTDYIDSEIKIDVRTLSGVPKELLNYFYIQSKQCGSRTIGPIRNTHVAEQLQKNKQHTKTVIYRLCKRGFLNRLSGLEGRNGYSIFEIPQSVYQQLTLEESINNEFQNHKFANSNQVINRLQTGSDRGTKQTTMASSSSSNIYNNKTTNTEEQITIPEISQEWLEINVPQIVKDIRFGKPQIKQLYKKGDFTAEEVQDFIDHLAYDLENNGLKNARSGPLSLFMGVLIKGQPYVSDNYVKELRADKEAAQKQYQEYKEMKKSLAEEELEKKFKNYKSTLSQEQIDEIVPPSEFVASGSNLQMTLLKEKYASESRK